MLHKDYHQSIRGEDGEEPIEALGSPPQTDMDSYYYSGPPTDLADTASLPRETPERYPLAYVHYTTMRRALVASITTHNNENSESRSSLLGGFSYPRASLWCS